METEVLDEIKKLRDDLKSSQQTATISSDVMNEVRQLHQLFESGLQEFGTKVNMLGEIGKLRQDIESRFGIKFDKESFTENDIFSFLFAVSNALYRFDREVKSKESDENSLSEARGYVAILNLALAWARVNGNDTVRKQLNELFPRAEAILSRMNEL